MKVLVRPSAAADIEDAFSWYATKGAALGRELLTEIRRAVDSVVEHPEAYPVLRRNTRRIRLRRFPYSLFYRVYSNTIVVVACMHSRRDPRVWKSRT